MTESFGKREQKSNDRERLDELLEFSLNDEEAKSDKDTEESSQIDDE